MLAVSDQRPRKLSPNFNVWLTGLNILFGFIIFCTAIAIYVPLSPQMPEVGLDPSWRFGMNVAVAQGMEFGKDVIFTFGPYASIYTQEYHPGTDYLMLLGSSYLALLFFILLVLNFSKAGLPIKAALITVLAGIVVPRDSLFFFYPLLMGVLSYKWAQLSSSDGRNHVFNFLLLFILFTPFGLLPLIKGSALFACLGIAFLSIVIFLLNRKWLYLVSTVCAPIVSMIFFWSVAGQPLSGLPNYFVNLLPIVSGYSEAMSVPGNPVEILAFLLASGTLLAVLIANLHGGFLRRAAPALMFFGIIFLGFKAGFVRHDGHAVIAAATLLLAALLATTLTGLRGGMFIVVLAFASWVRIDAGHINTDFNRVKSNLITTYSDAYIGLVDRVANPQVLMEKFDNRISEIRADANIQTLNGSVDIYSHDQSYLIASGNEWTPRPILQSYSVYTSGLALKNRDYLLGDQRPDHVIFKVQPIDSRLPALEDGASWPALLSNYDLASIQDGRLYLEARTGAEPVFERSETEVVYGSLNEAVFLPQTDELVYVEINLHKSFIGKVVNTLFKVSSPSIQVTLHNDTVRNYRFVPAMAEAGFIMSPLVESTEDMGFLFAGAGRVLQKDIRAFEIYAPYAALLWQDEFEVKFSTITHRPRTDFLDDPFFVRPIEMTSVNPGPTDRCAGSIDNFNGMVLPNEVMQVSGFFKIDGWLVASTEEAEVPERVFLMLDSGDSEPLFVEAERSARPDVAAHFGKPELQSAGFSVVADVSALDGAYDLTLAYLSGDDISFCPPMSLQLMIAGEENNE